MANHTTTIAKNTVFLYLRTFLILIVSIYTSRVLLATLGVVDYGIYNLVAGVVGLFASLKVVFASAVQRFLNYEKGKGNHLRQQHIFSLSLIIHIAIALFFACVVTAAGVWFIANRLNVPDGSIDTALFVFHCAVITAMFNILAIPFDAAIIANERLNFYAGLGIADALLKLLIIYILPLATYNYLKFYAFMIAGIGFLNLLTEIIYCHRFAECRLRFFWDKRLFSNLASFAGWNFLGNTAFALVNEGINMVLNIFGGVVANAARGIAYQVKSAVSQLSSNILIASQPHIIQQAAATVKENTFRNINKVSRILFFIMSTTLLPMIVYCEQLLGIWLIEVPPQSVLFVRLVLVHMIIRVLHGPMDILFKAFGKIGKYQIIDSITLFTALPASYILLKLGLPLYTAFIMIITAELLNICCIVKLAQAIVGFDIKSYLRQVLQPYVVILICLSAVGFVFYKFMMPSSWFLMIICMILYIISEVSVVYFFLNTEERDFIKKLINRIYS
ncbi:MAG: hypothetical protein J1E33_07045 [Alistipes sp.]|nr:hypothetical protein [Alistipes sp.]